VKFFCIGDYDTVAGFRLAGISGQVVTSPEDTDAALEKVSASTDIGIIIITEKLAEEIREKIEAMRQSHDRPLIVEISDASGPLTGRKSLRDFVQEAVGMRI
jgi:V/A-type H+/Na+-transporting ATPase subunit F